MTNDDDLAFDDPLDPDDGALSPPDEPVLVEVELPEPLGDLFDLDPDVTDTGDADKGAGNPFRGDGLEEEPQDGGRKGT